MKKHITNLIFSDYLLEARRKLMHIVFGMTILLSYFGLWFINIQQDFIIRLVLIGLFMLVTNDILVKKSLSSIADISKKLSERKATNISGVGGFMLLLGCYIPIALGLGDEIVAVVIISLSLGDGFATIIGKYFGKYSYAFSPSRSLMGTLGGLVAALVASWLIIDGFGWPLALACLLGSLIELVLGLLPERIDRVISQYSFDNVLIPLGMIGFLLYLV